MFGLCFDNSVYRIPFSLYVCTCTILGFIKWVWPVNSVVSEILLLFFLGNLVVGGTWNNNRKADFFRYNCFIIVWSGTNFYDTRISFNPISSKGTYCSILQGQYNYSSPMLSKPYFFLKLLAAFEIKCLLFIAQFIAVVAFFQDGRSKKKLYCYSPCLPCLCFTLLPLLREGGGGGVAHSV